MLKEKGNEKRLTNLVRKRLEKTQIIKENKTLRQKTIKYHESADCNNNCTELDLQHGSIMQYLSGIASLNFLEPVLGIKSVVL